MKINHLPFTSLLVLALVFAGSCNSRNTQSVISVYAAGSVTARPDMIQMVISLAETAPTTREAQEEVNSKVRDALEILKAAEIEDKNISTASLRFSPEYDWQAGRTLLGQRAEQTISFSITDIKSDNEKISKIIDQLIGINGIELQQFNFSIRDSAELFARSRELAYQKAREKAEQYAELSGLKIIKTLTVSEDGEDRQLLFPSNVMRNQMNIQAASGSAAGSLSSVVPSGELEISSAIHVSFLVK